MIFAIYIWLVVNSCIRMQQNDTKPMNSDTNYDQQEGYKL